MSRQYTAGHYSAVVVRPSIDSVHSSCYCAHYYRARCQDTTLLWYYYAHSPAIMDETVHLEWGRARPWRRPISRARCRVLGLAWRM